ncbi:MAG: hypothetical protein JRG91_03345 [Deltaproteobacteria bacterium]|nr:hypothetical protein [Deltaproteobacteria bacterium]
MPPSIPRLALPLIALAACACSGGPGSRDAGTDGTDDAAEVCQPGSGETLDLLGWWGTRAWVQVEMVTSPEGIVRMCPDPHPGIALLTLVINLHTQSGDRIDYEFVVCEIGMPTVTASLAPCSEEEFLNVNLELGPHLMAYIPSQEFHGHAEIGGTQPCSAYTSDTLDITYGYDPSVVASDEPLPGWDVECGGSTPEACVNDWGSVIDEDGDGHPGVSLQVTTDPVDTIQGQAYTTWRTNPHMHGQVWSSTLIQGDLSPTMEYDVVGSGADLQGIPMDEATVKRNIPRFLIPTTGSTYKMVRVDGEHGSQDLDADGNSIVTCEELMEHLEVLE